MRVITTKMFIFLTIFGMLGTVGCESWRRVRDGSTSEQGNGQDKISFQRDYPTYSEYWFANMVPPDHLEVTNVHFNPAVKVYAHSYGGVVYQLPDSQALFTVNGNTVIIDGLLTQYKNVSSVQIAW